MSKRLIINEEEKSEILKKHTDFKKILKEKLVKLNEGLVIEQFNTGVANDPLLTAAEKAKCISGGKFFTFEKKPAYYKVATVDRENRYSIGDKIVIYNDYTYEVFPKDGSKRKKFNWSCPQINQELDAKKAAEKKAEEEKRAKEQAGMTAEQKQFIDLLKGRGYVIDPLPSDIEEKQLERVALAKIPNLEKYFPNGLNVYSDPTIRSTTDVTDYTKRAGMMVGDVTKCKDIIEAYWEDYSGGGKGDPTDTLFLDAKNKAQACANKYYPKWNGLKSGVLGIASGQNHLNNIIDVLTGKEQSFKGVGIPSRTTGWGLTRPRRER